jgi:glycosyltransferase involved in cell wall biosynthesis
MRVVHFINGLGKGGAETMLSNVLRYRSGIENEIRVVSLGLTHYYEDEIRSTGAVLIDLDLRKRPFSALVRSFREIKKSDVLCCWMYHCNFLGYYLGRLAKCKRIVWNIRHSNFEPQYNNSLTLKIIRHCVRLSPRVDLIAYNGERARKMHEAMGYAGNSIVLRNGCDTEYYRLLSDAGQRLKRKLKIPEQKQIVLSVCRYHPIKDIPMFLDTFALIRKGSPNVVAVMCGNGLSADNGELCEQIAQKDLKIGQDIWLTGLRNDLPEYFSACDLFLLHSAGEAFPNTLLQAMACQCVCLSTDVGDAGKILRNPAYLFKSGDAYAMAAKGLELLGKAETDRAEIGRENSGIILKDYDLKAVIRSYESNFVEQ